MFESIFKLVAAATTLQKLDVSAPSPTHLSEADAPGLFVASHALTSLRLKRILIPAAALERHLEAVSGHAFANLSVLELRESGLAVFEARHLGSLLPHTPHLHVLALSDNELDASCIEALLQHLATHSARSVLKHFDLSGNPLGCEGVLFECGGHIECCRRAC